MKHALHVLALTLLLGATASHAQPDKYYKWVDDKGGVHYSARPPRDRPAQLIKMEREASPSPTPPSAPAKPGSEPTPAAPTTESEAPAAANAANARVLAAEAATNCEIARKNLNALSARARVRIKDEKTGEFRFLTPEEHAQWLQDSEAGVRDNCH